MDKNTSNLDFLYAALRGRRQDDLDEAKRILLLHPELSNLRKIDDTHHEDSTLLIDACRQGFHEIVTILLNNGAYVSATGRIHFIDPYMACSVTGGIMRNLYGCGFGALDNVFPLFAAAAFHAGQETLMAVFSAGADINQRTATGQTALHALFSWKDCRPQRELTTHNFNSLLRHKLDCISYFGRYFYFADFMMGDRSLKTARSSDVMVKFVLAAIDSCCFIQDQLNVESKPGCARELVGAMSQTLVIVRALIMHLIRRNDLNSEPQSKCESDPRIAKILLDEILLRCPLISAPACGFASPVTNILYNTEHKPLLFTHLTTQCLRYKYHFTKMIVESGCDLNATDCQGNTLLHSVTSDVIHEIELFSRHFHAHMPIVIATAVEMVKILLENGSYPQAKNKQGQCPGDGLQNLTPTFDPADPRTIAWNQEGVTGTHLKLTDLLNKYDCTLTLTYLAARKIVDSKIPYRKLLPKELVKFVDLH